jgi:phospholipase C
MPGPGVSNLKHIVVLMMENRSFDHMLGGLKQEDPRIDGLTGTETNPDTTGASISVQPLAEFQSQLDPDPGHHFPDVNTQLFYNAPNGSTTPTMNGFIQAYYQKRRDVNHSQKIMYYFAPEKLPVLTTLAKEYAVFNRWFSSIPGPTIPNRAFAHFGTSFGKVDMSIFYLGEKYLSIYERMLQAGRTAKIYYYDPQSSTIALTFLLKSQPKLFGTYDQFVADCKAGNLPDYSFIEPNFSDHDTSAGEAIASDQHPDHNVQAGELFIATVYNAIRANAALWQSTALLIVYDEHGGIYDHVPPPACTPDDSTDQATGFAFDRLGVRVPAVLISPWIPKGTVISPLNASGGIDQLRVFEHASIPATVTKQFIGNWDKRSPREKAADTFLDILSLPTARTDAISFNIGASAAGTSLRSLTGGPAAVEVPLPPASSMNPDRPISGLISDQITHLHKAELTLPPDQQTGIDVHGITTEREASEYIRQVTDRLQVRSSGGGR